MDITEDFYLVSPSNSSVLFYPDNTTSCYTTHLPREIHLKGDNWTVALIDIHVPNTVEHVEELESLYTVDGQKNYTLNPGVFESLDNFIHMVNDSRGIKGHHKIIPSSNRNGYYALHRICTCENTHTLMFHEKINKILGFEDDFALATNREITIVEGSKPASILNAIPDQLFVYCDVCLPSIVGDTQAPLLRIVTLDTPKYKFGGNTVRSFAPAQYKPLLQNSFHSILIDIRTNLGTRYPFTYGTLICTLHFKNER